ncbi:MAG: amidohydrolase/deacetylase family metallohydrolase [Eubacteriales bacterium]
MKGSLVIKGGRLLDLSSDYNLVKKDIYIKDGIIYSIEKDINFPDVETINLNGEIVSPGFIDMHTHSFTNIELGVKPDDVGIKKGTTTIFDAGSSGPKNFKDFLDNDIQNSITSVFALLNIAYDGLENLRYELSNMSNIKIDKVTEIVNKYRDYIVGIKARASASTVGAQGIKPIYMAKKIAVELNLPLVVHIGNDPPTIEDVLSLMEKGDVITHCFHGKRNGLLDEKGIVKKETQDAIDKGVIFDIGHGTSSFNFNVALSALKQGFYPDIISTDIYKDNIDGPVFDLQTTMNKLMALGVDLGAVIRAVTTIPAEVFKLKNFGRLEIGCFGDLTIFNILHQKKVFIDSEGNKIEAQKQIKIVNVIKYGIFSNHE